MSHSLFYLKTMSDNPDIWVIYFFLLIFTHLILPSHVPENFFIENQTLYKAVLSNTVVKSHMQLLGLKLNLKIRFLSHASHISALSSHIWLVATVLVNAYFRTYSSLWKMDIAGIDYYSMLWRILFSSREETHFWPQIGYRLLCLDRPCTPTWASLATRDCWMLCSALQTPDCQMQKGKCLKKAYMSGSSLCTSHLSRILALHIFGLGSSPMTSNNLIS